jgi:hypothetical protein
MRTHLQTNHRKDWERLYSKEEEIKKSKLVIGLAHFLENSVCKCLHLRI